MSNEIFNPKEVMNIINENVKLKAENFKLKSDIEFLKTLLNETEKERNILNDKLELIEKDLLDAINDNNNMFSSLSNFLKIHDYKLKKCEEMRYKYVKNVY